MNGIIHMKPKKKCHNIPVGKLKSVLDKCSIIYFIYKSWDKSTTKRTLNLTDEKENVLAEEMNEGQNDLVAMLQTSVSKRKLVSLFTSKIDEKMVEIAIFSETIKKQCDTLNKISQSYLGYVKQVQAPARTGLDLQQIMQETRNEELVQEIEQEVSVKHPHSWPNQNRQYQ